MPFIWVNYSIGAARGNPGPAASGVCAWWGHFMCGGFQSKGILIRKGSRLGTGTNNIAESHGIASASKTALHYFYWVTEQLAMLAQRPVSDQIWNSVYQLRS